MPTVEHVRDHPTYTATVQSKSGGPAERFYRPELDTVRFFAFFAVFLTHTLPNTAMYEASGVPHKLARVLGAISLAGNYGVDLFFILSAYLITELLLRELQQRQRIDLRAFYIRRALRIWPLYYGFLALTIFVVPHVLPQDTFPMRYRLAYAAFLGNWSIVAWRAFPNSVVAPLWSVSIEEQFYLAWPLLLRVAGAWRLRPLAWTMIAVAIATRAYLAWTGARHPAVWCNTLARMDPIAGGALLASYLKGGVPRFTNVVRTGLAGAALALLVIVAGVLPMDGWRASLTFPLVTVACLLGVLSLLGIRAGWAHSRGLVYLGRISFGLYVFHFLALWLGDRVLAHAGGWPLRLIVGLGVTIALATLSYEFFERPFLRLKSRFAVIASRPA